METKQQRDSYLATGAVVLGLGTMVFWGLSAINDKARRDARQSRRLQTDSNSSPR